MAIILINKYEVIIDDDDLTMVLSKTWSAGQLKNGPYFLPSSHRREDITSLHRFIIGCYDRKMYVDHINGNKLDNRKTNLRICLPKENSRNQRLSRRNTCGYKGVTMDKRRGKWIAQITVDQKHIWLGYFSDPKKAHDAYCEAAVKYFGEFARFK